MKAFFEFCGLFMAHAIWSVSDGEIVVPFLAVGKVDGEKTMNRFVNDEQYEKAVEAARQSLDEQLPRANFAAAYFDGYFTFDSGERSDAVYVIGKCNGPGKIHEITIAIPYQRKESGRPFKVFKPKLIGKEHIDDAAIPDCFEAFWDGVDSHKAAASIWNAALDQSK